MKRRMLIVMMAAVLLLGCVFSGCASGDTGETASVQSVAMICGIGNTGVYDSYAGVVVSQQTVEIKKDTEKTLDEIFVEEGQSISIGQKLFSYNVEDLQFSLDKAKLELEQLQNTITSCTEQIAQLEKDKAKAPSSEQLSYSVQIQSVSADLREAEYNKSLKEKEVSRIEASVGNPVVTAEVAGVIQALNPEGGYNQNTGEELPFMTIVETGTYRVKGTINESAAGALQEGMSILVRSRVNPEQTWAGVVSMIDWENPSQGNNNGYYMESSDSEMTQSSKYPFYVELYEIDGLMLGQHVYIEPDFGQENVAEGLQLPEYYINDVDSEPWVWAASSKDKLEKRSLTLGDYNADLGTYTVVDGLTEEDYIAYPDETFTEGMNVTKFDEAYFEDAGNGEYDGDIGYSDSVLAAEEAPYTSSDVVAVPIG